MLKSLKSQEICKQNNKTKTAKLLTKNVAQQWNKKITSFYLQVPQVLHSHTCVLPGQNVGKGVLHMPPAMGEVPKIRQWLGDTDIKF